MVSLCSRLTMSFLPRYSSLEFLKDDSGMTYDFFGDPIPSTSKTFSNDNFGNHAMDDTENDMKSLAKPLYAREKTVSNASYQAAASLPNAQRQTNQDSSKRSIPDVISGGQALRSVVEIPDMFQSVFQSFPYFNVVQSKIMDDVFYSDKSLVVCAPTGSGKTVIFELAIIRLLMHCAGCDNSFKIIYMAPIKALCSERYDDWKEKFLPFGITCFELTGDTDVENYSKLQMVNLIFTTPEKWDSTTRRWKDNRYLVQLVRLFLIDEIHVVNDKNRGATVEAVISRMMTIHGDLNLQSTSDAPTATNSIRILGVSATIPNTKDFAEWFGYGGRPSASQKVGEEFRPVKLQKVVIGYPCPQNWTDFRFDMTLSYKLITIINRYSEGKPSLVFCSTRKGVIQTSSILVNESKLILSTQLKQKLVQSGNTVRDNKLKELLTSGVGYHHAGLDYHDRKIVEDLFVRGELPILIATSTLAMGVNLPAHLVIVKSTMYYDNGQFSEYNDTQILQMIGRAGRPQFDTSATAVIMTKDYQKAKYEKFVSGNQIIESSLHKKLAEYLNVEIVLKTITDLAVAMQWIRSTFLYVRIMKNPTHYGLSVDLSKSQIEQKLQEMCVKELNSLAAAQLIQMGDDGFDLKSTEAGRLMAQYCVSLNTMKKFRDIKGTDTISDLLQLLSASEEFCEIQLRTSEKKTLNTLNKDKNLQTIRFPMNGKIRNRDMKINCLIQAAFGCITIQDWTLTQETSRILRIGQRLSKCLSEYVSIKDDFKSVLGCILLAKCFRAHLWENSKYIARQLEKIGNTLSNNLVNAGLTTFQKIEEANPRQLEMILNRHPPFGSHIRDAVAKLPKYEVAIEQIPKYSQTTADVGVTVTLRNFQFLKENGAQWANPCAVLIIGDEDNKIVFKQRIVNSLNHGTGKWYKRLNVNRAQRGNELTIKLINEQYVGLDVRSSFTPFYIGGKNVLIKRNFTLSDSKSDDAKEHSSEDELEYKNDSTQKPDEPLWQFTCEKDRTACGHRCINKSACAHQCCKFGVTTKKANANISKTNKSKNAPKEQTKGKLSATITRFCTEVKNKAQTMPIKGCSRTFVEASPRVNLKQFEYQPTPNASFSMTSGDDVDDCWADDDDECYFAELEEENLIPRQLKGPSYSEALDGSFPEDDFGEVTKEEDDDVMVLPYDGSVQNSYDDFTDMTVEDFQDDKLELDVLSLRKDFPMPNYEGYHKFPKRHKLPPKYACPLQSDSGLSSYYSSHEICLRPSEKYARVNERSNSKPDYLAANSVSASKIYGDLLLDSGEVAEFDHRTVLSPLSCYRPKLPIPISAVTKCGFATPNVDHEVSHVDANMPKTDSTVKHVSPVVPPKLMPDAPEIVITTTEMERNPELREAVHTYHQIFSDLF